MNKALKRTVTFFLTAVMMFSSCVLPSLAAVSFNSGIEQLRSQWYRDCGPYAGGFAIDYSYYSPVIDGADTNKKYPLFVVIAGKGEGEAPGTELTSNTFAYWSSAEFQSIFHNGAGYLLIARAPEEKLLYWDNDLILPGLKAAIDDFVERNSLTVDTDRIFILGWCLGGSGAIKMVINYNDYFAGAVIISAPYAISDSQIKAFKNTAVWLFGCEKDSYSWYATYTVPNWEKLKKVAKDKSKIRFTKCSSAPHAGALLYHNMWRMVTVDMQADAGCEEVMTFDGYGNSIEKPEVINWMSCQSLVKGGENTCSCQCHSKNGWIHFLWFIRSVFYRLAGMDERRYCQCGEAHW